MFTFFRENKQGTILEQMALRRLPKRWKWTQHWMRLISSVSESPCLPAVWFLFSIFSRFTPFAVRLANSIGDAGAKRLADMLKVNTVLTAIFLNSELCFDLYFRVCRTVPFPDLCSLRYRQSHWWRWYQRYRRGIESERKTVLHWFTRCVKSLVRMFFIHHSPFREQKP